MATTITINYTELVAKNKDVELPAFLTSAGIFYKVISEDTLIQVIPTADQEAIKKWRNANTVTKLLTDPAYIETDEISYTQALSTTKAALSE